VDSEADSFHRNPRYGVSAGVMYLVLSAGIFGRQVLWDPANSYVGGGHDPSQMMWFLVWWPYAIAHRLNPFITEAVWPPAGVNLAWATPIPALSFLSFPVTYSLGPVVSYNFLSLLAPALSAWSAFLLCDHITRRFWPSVAGGYLYGFSSYEVGHVLGGHLGHSFVMLPPLAVLLLLRYADGDLSRFRFVIYLAGCLFLQFLISAALFATLTVFGAIVLLLAWFLGDPSVQFRLLHSTPCILPAYALSAFALSPYFYYIVAFGMPHSPIMAAGLLLS
jgi:hypothetical protein